MRLFLLLCFICFNLLPLQAQDPARESLFPCGAPPGISAFLRQYHQNPDLSLAYRSEDTLWVAVQAHLLAKDNGSGRVPWDRLLNAFCRLNQDFAAAKIQFYFKDPWNLIDNTGWHAHGDILEGIDMMLTNNVDGALNAYFVSDPAGNCGYNLPYAGVAIAHGCAGPNDHTWAHEVGHALNLPHPFIGWEGKTYSYNVPTPELLTYDYTHFHDSLETQIPAPLDTALVEFVDGSNCAIAADLICDTKPDYLSYRWNCNPSTQQSTALQKDPNGEDFLSDGTLFMSYADDACQNRFSPEEIAIMRATLATEKLAWVAPAMNIPAVSGTPVHVEPVQGQDAPVNGAKLVWTSVPGATHYHVQVSRLSSFGFKELDVITTDTTAICGLLAVNKTYYWRVKPFNMRDACQPVSTAATFLTVPVTAAFEPDADGWRCYPSLLKNGQAITMEIPEKWRGEDGQIRVFDAAGKLVWEQFMQFYAPEIKVQMPTNDWAGGVYHCLISTAWHTKRQTVFLQR